MYIHIADDIIISSEDIIAVVGAPPDGHASRRRFLMGMPIEYPDAPLSVRTYIVTPHTVYALHMTMAAVRRRLQAIHQGMPVSFYTRTKNNV